jgi:hypothetical protein
VSRAAFRGRGRLFGEAGDEGGDLGGGEGVAVVLAGDDLLAWWEGFRPVADGRPAKPMDCSSRAPPHQLPIAG